MRLDKEEGTAQQEAGGVGPVVVVAWAGVGVGVVWAAWAAWAS